MSPIERAARALCSLDGHLENATMGGKPLWQDYLPEVRAVLQAIREPSEGMIEAGQATECEHGDMNCGCAVSWTAMIDRALTE